MARPSKKSPPPPSKLSYEQAVEELELIVEQVEAGKIGLEDTLAARRRGEALIERCRSILEAAEQELKRIKPEDEGTDDEEPSPDATS